MQKLKQQQLFDRVFEQLPDHITLLLIIVSGFLLARLTWMMFPADPTISAPLVMEQQETGGVSVIQAHAKTANLGQEIASYHLLGVYQPPKPVPVQKAAVAQPAAPPPPPKPQPKVREPLNLVGVYALQGRDGIAIINVKGQQQVVGLGEQIAETDAKLTRVSAEEVEVVWEDGEKLVLNMPNIDKSALGAVDLPPDQQPQPEPEIQIQNPELQDNNLTPEQQLQQQVTDNPVPQQTEPLDTNQPVSPFDVMNQNQSAMPPTEAGVDPVTAAAAPQPRFAPASSTSAGGNDQAPAVQLADFRQQVMENNINLLQLVRPSPARREGQLIGFRVRPGTNLQLFQQTGLKSGDIVTAINGMPLNSNASSMQAMQNLATSSGATLTIERAGQQTVLEVAF